MTEDTAGTADGPGGTAAGEAFGERAIGAAGALADPVRRRLYRYVCERGEAGRSDAAEALGITRTLAAFHLDRLAGAGLLEVERRRLSGRQGPGAGRPAKVYRRSGQEVSLHLPPRDYEAAARLLAEAVERAGAEEALYAVAREEGRRRAAEAEGAGSAGAPVRLEEVARALAACGYEPVAPAAGQEGGEGGEGGEVRLRNCPFRSLAADFPPLTCGMNLELLRGTVERWGGFQARTAPEPGGCCVAISKNNED
ncbi:helix-turn-helix domain-containing protein [Nocardiopsis sp. RSe5-2]|uniref:Helix-turn-helix domain-containing protein n=1 Tax=Nocardiopsis endophytica TaxID=3018445 RepID=A0ABT4UAW8_9ACTN|nr:helix-turn-helix domain-containing protein [Nocardiopsis endophytica]MDA2814124.1 helix-turn-helix domain-containing protein [Nocardiopsis endophytica]